MSNVDGEVTRCGVFILGKLFSDLLVGSWHDPAGVLPHFNPPADSNNRMTAETLFGDKLM